MDKEEALRVCDGTAMAEVLAERVISTQWAFCTENFDVSDLEAEGVMFEGLLATLLFGLMAISEKEGINFERNLCDARRMKTDRVKAYKVLHPVQ